VRRTIWAGKFGDAMIDIKHRSGAFTFIVRRNMFG